MVQGFIFSNKLLLLFIIIYNLKEQNLDYFFCCENTWQIAVLPESLLQFV